MLLCLMPSSQFFVGLYGLEMLHKDHEKIPRLVKHQDDHLTSITSWQNSRQIPNSKQKS